MNAANVAATYPAQAVRASARPCSGERFGLCGNGGCGGVGRGGLTGGFGRCLWDRVDMERWVGDGRQEW